MTVIYAMTEMCKGDLFLSYAHRIPSRQSLLFSQVSLASWKKFGVEAPWSLVLDFFYLGLRIITCHENNYAPILRAEKYFHEIALLITSKA